ncbi:TetR/AcrR family transcriptional regulator C-terminal ligand-binding domain-containing protein [Yinghuangia sp. ASG 101]|uniref:TetR-like C-terminal domain-containing protein n=1 Tax=Yinghuangia sp. ASG 101 TaxID=2896848 RepID=UPI001E4139EB|nr:TetR-like C-terminal domain-containing protein [Yinghuangia sp. ASG 101]UGQ11380.1 TetR/AcrR family transcriptional regulator C-terminal ligand-binding domain-containing protein [Yinghuangia sp. ASG 101]
MIAKTRGRKPDPEVDAAIRAAVDTLIAEKGLDVTYDQVAAYARVGRASVFRRYPTKRDMLLDAIERTGGARLPAPDTGSLRGDLVTLIAGMTEVYGAMPMSGISRNLFAEAPNDPQILFILRELNARRQEVVDVILDQAVRRGEIGVGAPRKAIGDLIAGYFVGLLTARQDLPGTAEIDRLAGLLADGLGVRTSTGVAARN